MSYETYQPPGDHDLASALAADLPCGRCGQPPSRHAFDLICPRGEIQPAAPEPPEPPDRAGSGPS